MNKGYTPKVRGILPERLIEVIDIDKNMDTLPLLEELQTVPGVVATQYSVALGPGRFLPVVETIMIQYDA